MRFSLLSIAIAGGCRMHDVEAVVVSARGHGRSAGKPDAADCRSPWPARRAAKSPRPNRPSPTDRAMADYLRDLAKGVELEQSRQYCRSPQALRASHPAVPRAATKPIIAWGRFAIAKNALPKPRTTISRRSSWPQGREPDLFNDLGYSFFLQGKLDKAESAIRKAVALRADRAQVSQ